MNSPVSVPSGAHSAQEWKTINGEVQIGGGSSTKGAKTINGAINVAPGCTIERDLASVNGDVTVARNSRIYGCVRTVNGRINLHLARVDQDISTYNGEIRLAGVKVGGDIVIKKPDYRGDGTQGTPVEIYLSDGTEVQGRIHIEEEDRKVVVHMGIGSSVRGGVGRAKLVTL